MLALSRLAQSCILLSYASCLMLVLLILYSPVFFTLELSRISKMLVLVLVVGLVLVLVSVLAKVLRLMLVMRLRLLRPLSLGIGLC